MKKFLFAFALIVFLNACDSTRLHHEQPPPPTKPPTLPFTDSDDFDEYLSKTLLASGKVEIQLASSIEPDAGEMPERLDKWLAVIQKSGGSQDYEAIDDSMGGLPSVLMPFEAIYDGIIAWLEERMYQPAKQYNARLCYRRDDNLVSKIVFIERNQSNSDLRVCGS